MQSPTKHLNYIWMYMLVEGSGLILKTINQHGLEKWCSQYSTVLYTCTVSPYLHTGNSFSDLEFNFSPKLFNTIMASSFESIYWQSELLASTGNAHT